MSISKFAMDLLRATAKTKGGNFMYLTQETEGPSIVLDGDALFTIPKGADAGQAIDQLVERAWMRQIDYQTFEITDVGKSIARANP